MAQLIARHRPDCVAVEDVFYARNVLIPAGRPAQAIQLVDKIPFDNDNYFFAQAQKLVWLKQEHDHPAASAGAIFQMASIRGKFQGTMAAHTPRGSRSV